MLFFIEDENDSDQEEEDDKNEEALSVDSSMSNLNSGRVSKLDKIQRKSSLFSTKVLWTSSEESVHIVCQTCTESNAAVDSAGKEDICVHKPILHISNDDEVDQNEKETTV